MRNNHIPAVMVIGILALASCRDKNPSPDIMFSIPLNTRFENPMPAGRTETGLLTMQLYGNNVLRYSFRVDNLTPGDQLTMAHFHVGDPVTNGPIIQDFPAFTGTTASGEITLRKSLADSLKHSENDIYFNVHSTQVPGGLVRGTVNSDIVAAADVALTGQNEAPPVVTTATGTALIRLTIGRKLYAKVIVTNLPAGETLTGANILKGAAGVNGNVLIPLCTNATDFGISKMRLLDEATANAIRTEATYVNVYSDLHPIGLIRGQIK